MRPGDADIIRVEVDAVVGGAFRFDTRTKEGEVHVHTGQYLEISRPDKLVFTWNSTRLGEHSSQVTVEFYEHAGNCVMVLTHDLPADADLVEDHRQGWTTIFEYLARQLAGGTS